MNFLYLSSVTACLNLQGNYNCNSWAKMGYCRHTAVDHMRSYCKLACNLCDESTTETTSKSTTESTTKITTSEGIVFNILSAIIVLTYTGHFCLGRQEGNLELDWV